MSRLSTFCELYAFLSRAHPTRVWVVLLGAALLSLGVPISVVAASPEQIKARKPVAELNVKEGVAVKGYDVVAYFTDGKPAKGSAEFSYKWQGATWQFGSAEHRDTFIKEPAKYAPKYGGYCAFAVSQGNIVDIDPNQWKIVGGKLYLNANPLSQSLWARDPEGHIKKGDANWPLIPRKKL